MDGPEQDTAERLVRWFFAACESPRRRARAERVLRRAARSALGGMTLWDVLNRLVSSRASRLVGGEDRARRMQLVSAHLLGLAYMRYVFELEPTASMPIDDLIAMSVPVVRHYLADCPPVH